MRIDRIELDNYRCFERFETELHPEFNIFIGPNGAGKTTLLKALTQYLEYWLPGGLPELAPDDVRATFMEVQRSLSRQDHFPCKVTVAGMGADQAPCRVIQERNQNGASPPHERMLDDARSIHLRASGEFNETLPVIARFMFDMDRKPSRKLKFRPVGPLSRLDGYKGVFKFDRDAVHYEDWFKTLELASVQEGITIPALEAVREAIRGCLPGCTQVKSYIRTGEIYVWLADGEIKPIKSLSDGYQSMLSIVAWLAFRSVVLNPQLGQEAPLKTPGVVLIDDLDHQIHPEWQRRVVRDLRSAFPRVQFISTTHSPFIIQSMHRDEVIILDESASSLDYWREGIEDISIQSMGVEDDKRVPRSAIYRDLEQVASVYYSLLDANPQDLAAIATRKKRLDELEEYYTDNPALAAFLKTERLRREAGR